MTDRLYELWEEAEDLLINSRYYEAALTYEQTRQLAKDLGMDQEAAGLSLMTAICWSGVGRPLKAIGIYMELIAFPKEIIPDEVRLAAHLGYISISMDYLPSTRKLEKSLEAIDQLYEGFSDLGNIDYLLSIKGGFYANRGLFRDALRELEAAWKYQDTNKEDCKWEFVEIIHECNLRLGNERACQRWISLVWNSSSNRPYVHFLRYIICCDFALYQGRWEDAERYAVFGEERVVSIQDYSMQLDMLYRRVTSLLLREQLGDPRNIHHPARFRLRQRQFGKLAVQEKYNRKILLINYRLACVRYILGTPPVDDMYYQEAQKIPKQLHEGFKLDNFLSRVESTQRAIRSATIIAQYLDDAFQCDWRQKEVQDRQDRLDELVNFVKSQIGDFPC